MAGDWIPISTNVHTKPEVLRIATGSGRTRFEVVGLLAAFWSWASDHSEDGRLDGIEIDHLESLIGGDDVFWKQVEAVGWLKVTPQCVSVPNFETWLSRGAKRRVKENARKGRSRKEGAKKAHGVRKMSASHADKKRNTEENSTEEKDHPRSFSSSTEDGRKDLGGSFLPQSEILKLVDGIGGG